MRIQKVEYDMTCEDCLKDYPESPLQATTIIDRRYLCNVHADEVINQDLYDKIDKEYDHIDEDD